VHAALSLLPGLGWEDGTKDSPPGHRPIAAGRAQLKRHLFRVRYWQTVFGYRQVTEIVTTTRQKVRVVFLAKRGSLQVMAGKFVIKKSAGQYHFVLKAANGEILSRISGISPELITESPQV
jgi:hypothetical protein